MIISRLARRLPQRFVRFNSTTAPRFPCVDAHSARESRILASFTSAPPYTPSSPSTPETGPEPPYARPAPSQYQLFSHKQPFDLVYHPTNPLPEFDIAYETWGTLNGAKDNAILLHTGLSASSHAASTERNPSPGWWEAFIGPDKALDTNKFFVICTNVLGGCYGSTGPSSPNPSTGNTKPYGTRFPILSILDMVKAQFHLLDHLGIGKLYASVGSSMGGMQSLAAGWMFPDRVGRIVSISATARSSPSAIAMRYAQRSVLMADPNWNNGFYYDSIPPHTGMKLARQIATITYRSGPEWEQRFGRDLRPLPESSSESTSTSPSPKSPKPHKPRTPALCPDFLIETYLDHQGESFCLKYDANSLIYISKAMDLFDLSLPAIEELGLVPPSPASSHPSTNPTTASSPKHKPLPPQTPLSLGLSPLSNTPTLILASQSDILFPRDQQHDIYAALLATGNTRVRYYELGGVWGHDTFLIDVGGVGGAVRGFLV